DDQREARGLTGLLADFCRDHDHGGYDLATPSHHSLRVLFVDDEKSLQEFMHSELPRLGHEVAVYPDGRSALKALEKTSFDVALLDLRMPGMGGMEVLEQLKQIAPDTEALVMTG